MKNDNPVHKKNLYWWSTEDEKNFIDHIGTYSKEARYCLDFEENSQWAARRVKLLEGYLKAILERVNWDHINREEIMVYASKALLEAGRAVYGENYGKECAEKEVGQDVSKTGGTKWYAYSSTQQG